MHQIVEVNVNRQVLVHPYCNRPDQRQMFEYDRSRRAFLADCADSCITVSACLSSTSIVSSASSTTGSLRLLALRASSPGRACHASLYPLFEEAFFTAYSSRRRQRSPLRPEL